MSDPSSAADIQYKMGATTLVGGAYELAAKLEETNTALVMGTYRPRTTTGTTNSAAVTSTGTSLLYIATSDAGKVLNGDYVAGAYTGKISSFVFGTTIALGTNSPVTGTGDIYIAATESAGLIFTGSTAITNKGVTLPY